MDLTSCEECGVVLDKNNLPFPDEDEIWNEDYGYILDKSVWCNTQERYLPATPCPVCKNLIKK